MALAVGACDRLAFERQHGEVVREALTRRNRIETLGQLRILRGDACWIAPFVPIVVAPRSRAELAIFLLPARMIVAEGNECCRADRDGVRAECQRFGDIRARANAAGHDELHLAMHVELGQGLYSRADRRERRQSAMLDKHVLRRRRTALHAVEHHNVGAGLHRERRVVVRPRRADLDVDRFLPAGDLAQF